MNTSTWRLRLATAAAVALTACASTAPVTPAATPAGLEGTSWRLVQINMSDGATRAAIERSRYHHRLRHRGTAQRALRLQSRAW